ncbi:MAG: hypothetical protein WCD57_06285 [Acidobacteriaceae bacterium]
MGDVSPVGPEGKKTIVLSDLAVLADRSGQAFASSSGYQDVS